MYFVELGFGSGAFLKEVYVVFFSEYLNEGVLVSDYGPRLDGSVGSELGELVGFKGIEFVKYIGLVFGVILREVLEDLHLGTVVWVGILHN